MLTGLGFAAAGLSGVGSGQADLAALEATAHKEGSLGASW